MTDVRTISETKQILSDPRFDGNAPLYVRVVDRGRKDGPYGSFHADEYPIVGGMTGWEDGHASILAYAPTSTPRPEVVVLCGSTRFRSEFEQTERRLGLDGKIVLTVACFGHDGDLAPADCIAGSPVKDALDELHKRKIDLADRVLVVNVNGYVGDSTRSEIDYAERHGKPVEYLTPITPIPST